MAAVLQKICCTDAADVNDLVDEIVSNEVQLDLVQEPDARTAHALAGTRINRGPAHSQFLAALLNLSRLEDNKRAPKMLTSVNRALNMCDDG